MPDQRRPRVVQLVGPSTGGIRRHVAQLSACLEERGWETTVAGPADVLARLDRGGVEVPVPDGLSPSEAWAARRALAGAVRAAHIVHAHGLKPGWLAASLASRPPLVVSVHNLVLDEVRGRSARFLRFLEARLPARADATIAISREVARRFTGLPGADRIHVVPPLGPVVRPTRPAPAVRADLGVGSGEHLVVAVARLNPQKDLATLLDAADQVRRRVDGVRLVVFGEGPLEAELRRRVAQLELEDVVTLAGPRPSVVDELAAADVVVVSSRWESGPLVALEALQLGRPLVSTPVGAVPELVEDGVTGRIFPIGDAVALADALAEVLTDAEHAATMAAAGRRRVAERFGPDVLVAGVEAVYREVLPWP